MKKESNIIESIEFLAAEELLVAELDKRLSFSALLVAEDRGNNNGHCESLCNCIADSVCLRNKPSPYVSAIRG